MNNNVSIRRKRRKLSSTGKIILISIPILIIIILYTVKTITYKMSDEYKIGELGYSDNDVEYLIKSTEKDKTKRETIMKMRYDTKIPRIMKQKYFMWKHLDTYLEYSHKFDDMDLKEVIAKVNTKRNTEVYTNVKKVDISKNETMLINKYYKLDSSYVPKNLVEMSNKYSYDGNKTTEEVYEAYKNMWNAANLEGLTLIVTSSYRDYDSQNQVWESYSNSKGEEFADSKAARAGHSEHQSGLALDIVTYNIQSNDFENTEEFKWLEKNAHKYGFILRFPKDKEDITGYSYESWHYRYVGIDIATKVKNAGITYDEYYAYYLDK